MYRIFEPMMIQLTVSPGINILKDIPDFAKISSD